MTSDRIAYYREVVSRLEGLGLFPCAAVIADLVGQVLKLEGDLEDERAGRALLARATDRIGELQALVDRLGHSGAGDNSQAPLPWSWPWTSP